MTTKKKRFSADAQEIVRFVAFMNDKHYNERLLLLCDVLQLIHVPPNDIAAVDAIKTALIDVDRAEDAGAEFDVSDALDFMMRHTVIGVSVHRRALVLARKLKDKL